MQDVSIYNKSYKMQIFKVLNNKGNEEKDEIGPGKGPTSFSGHSVILKSLTCYKCKR